MATAGLNTVAIPLGREEARVGKKASGASLDGSEHMDFPGVVSPDEERPANSA
jgi:hypothetical protein